MAKRLIETLCSGSIETAIKAARIGREIFYGWARAVRQGSATGLHRRPIAEVNPTEAESRLPQERMHISVDKNWRWRRVGYSGSIPTSMGGGVPTPRQSHNTAQPDRMGTGLTCQHVSKESTVFQSCRSAILDTTFDYFSPNS